MKVAVLTLDNKSAGDLELNDSVFGLTARKDILHRVVEWQRAKARAGTHSTKVRGEVSGTTKKPHKQKGSGRARQGSLRGPHMEGGSRSHGPVVRSHEYSLPKKVRALGLRMALSAKQAAGQLKIVDGLDIKDAKTAEVAKKMMALGLTKPLFIDGQAVNESFARSARNLKGVDVLPVQGANVYDILRHKELVLTKEAVASLEARLA